MDSLNVFAIARIAGDMQKALSNGPVPRRNNSTSSRHLISLHTSSDVAFSSKKPCICSSNANPNTVNGHGFWIDEKGNRKGRSHEHKFDVGKNASAVVVGLSLAGVGFFLGWNLGWMISTFLVFDLVRSSQDDPM